MMKKLSLKHDGVIAVDLDSTLAEYSEWKGIEHIGKPIPAMLARVKKWLEDGTKVVIFTARIDNEGAEPYIEKWLEENGIGGLKITNVKSMDIVEFWDDRAVQVIPNTGERIDGKE